MTTETTPATLDELFDSISWDRKFSHHVPSEFTELFRSDDLDEAIEYFAQNAEEDSDQVRAAYLFSDSLGQALAVNESDWDSE